jgi:hypothetical protein
MCPAGDGDDEAVGDTAVSVRGDVFKGNYILIAIGVKVLIVKQVSNPSRR